MRRVDGVMRPVSAGHFNDLCRLVSARAGVGETAAHVPRQILQDPVHSTRATSARGGGKTRGQSTRSYAFQTSLQQWSGLDGSWRRLASSSRGAGIPQQLHTWNSLCKRNASGGAGGGYVDAATGVGDRRKHTPKITSNERTGSSVPEPDGFSVHAVRSVVPDLEPPNTTRSPSVTGKREVGGGDAGMWDADAVKNADMKQISSLLNKAQGCAPEMIPVLLRRIAALLPPPSASQKASGITTKEKTPEAGKLVRALLSQANQHLEMLDTQLIANILSSAAKLSHLPGMHLWFTYGGAGGMGARSLLTLATRADELPPAHVAHVLGALGRLRYIGRYGTLLIFTRSLLQHSLRTSGLHVTQHTHTHTHNHTHTTRTCI
jgi:hypothetical protein